MKHLRNIRARNMAVLALFILLALAIRVSSDGNALPCETHGISCEPRSVSDTYVIIKERPSGAAFQLKINPPDVEETLEMGLDALGLSPVHIAARTTATRGSTRCIWHGVARTLERRENEIRFFLGIDDDVALPSSVDIKRQFMIHINDMPPLFRPEWSSNITALVDGGVSTEYLFLSCYVDYTVQAYFLGNGPMTLTVAYTKVDGGLSYDLYSRIFDKSGLPSTNHLAEPEFVAGEQLALLEAESRLSDIVEGRESVVFLAPVAAHGSVVIEAWQAIEQWDLQSEDHDDDEETAPVVHAVRYGVSEGNPEYKQTLANLKSRVTTAAAADDFADDRIANVSGLTQYYRTIGAYGDITPDDSSTTTFTPAQPPPALTCASGTAITTPADNRALVRDCQTLLDAKDSLRGTGALNWSTSTAISSWDGVTTSGTSTRVTKVELDSESLTGVIPSELGSLFELTHLKLNSNTLTGSIPRELGWLYNLEEIKLSGNSLTGCIPIALEDVATNDLSSLNLLYCRPPAPESLSATKAETSITASWGAVSNTTKYRVEYREALPIDWTTATETLTTTSHSFSDLACGTPYQFRVSAFGSGTTYAAAWSEPSAILSADTGECVAPTFDEESYDFTVSAHAAVRTAIATVSATDPNGDSITYSITAGNTGNKFGINSSTGAITVEASFGGTSSTAALTVRASDGTNMATTTVNVTVEGSKITFSGLESSLERWDLINFEVDAENLDPTRSHTLEVTSSNTNMVFNNPFRCVGSSTSWSRTPPARSIKSGAILLHACRVPGGTITAVLKQGTTTLLTERFAVAVSLPATPRLPSIEFVNLSPTPMQGMVDPFSVRAFYLGETTSYTIRVTTDNANLGFDSTCSIRFHEHETTASNITAFRLLRLHACSAPGGTLTASLLRNGSVVATASENIAVRLPANPSIEISGLASKLVEGRSDSFDVTATNLTTNSSFYLELRTSSRNLGFNSGCSISSDEVVPARGQTTHSATFILHACTGPAGTVTAALIRGTRTVDTATFNVTIVAPPENAPSTPTGLSASLANDAFTLSWDALDGAAKYEPQYGTGDSTITWTALPETTTTGATYSPTDGPDCGTKYNFRVRAFGDDTTFTDAWGAPSAAQSIDTEACNVPPEFDPMSYTFSIAENIAAGTAVGTVTASDEDTDDELSYSITSGNTGDVFAITETSGAITVTGALDHETTASYSLTVEVDDGREGTDTATVAITVTDVAEDTPPAPENLDASLAGSTFSLSWDSLSGAANYEPQYRTGDSDDDWMELPTTTGVSTTFSPTDGPACGTTYGFRVRAYGDATKYIADWGTPSATDSVTTDACNVLPEFDPAVYAFSVAENAATGTSGRHGLRHR